MNQEREEAEGSLGNDTQGSPDTSIIELASTVDKLQTDLKERTSERDALNDRLLRLHAEFENYKKRVTRERSEFVRFANEGLILELLPVVDNLEHAVATARLGGEVQGVAEGINIILRLFLTTLEKVGVKPIEALGHEFDPNFHQAVAQIESTDDRDNIAVEEVRKGYLLEGRLLRPAMVKVSKAKVSGSACEVQGSEKDQYETRSPGSGVCEP